MRTQVAAIINSMTTEGKTLKSSKIDIADMWQKAGDTNDYLTVLVEDACKAVSKLDFEARLNNFLDKFEESKLTEASPVTELERLHVEITKVLQTVGAASHDLGELLIAAKEASENLTEFLEWVGNNFGIKRAWAFQLMKVAKVFQDEVWKGTSVRVLYTLQAQADDKQLASARKLAEEGLLNHNTLNELLTPPVAPAKSPSDSTSEGNSEVGAVPFDTGATVIIDLKSAPLKNESSDSEEVSLQDKLLSKISELTDIQSRLLLQNEDLQRQLADYKTPKLRTNDLPMLRQFNSASHAARLGISLEEGKDKVIILEAFKSLCKAGYGRGHEAFALIDEARHELIHAI